MSTRSRFLPFVLLAALLLSACQPVAIQIPIQLTPGTVTPTPFQPVEPTPTNAYDTLWIDPAVPTQLRDLAVDSGIELLDDSLQASVRLELASTGSTWIYALVAPFPTVTDGVTLDELKSAWLGTSSGPFNGSPLYMAESTRAAFNALWGEAGTGSVQTVAEDELINTLWQNRPSWGIVPFEGLDPQLKVLTVDDQSPIRREFDAASYPLKASFALTAPTTKFSLPDSNRDASKMTTIIMTGVTALVRATAVKMEKKGVLYPAEDIGDTLRDADITHISNEIPFYDKCPYPDASQKELRFCSDPKYIELLKSIGTDVVELTGNHFEDYGPQATLDTLAMYNELGWPYYGGGANLEDSMKPAILEHNGNRFAFIGCNPVGPIFAWAREDRPGAAPCKNYTYDWLKAEVTRLKSEGYIVIVTFQYYEYYDSEPIPQHVADFRSMVDAGATIVSGSQAHFPQAMDFYKDTFIHYGLGNLFFDQMDIPGWGTRREFIDRHVFYDGKHISTELITAMLEDFARPRLMTPEERQTFLETLFKASGW